MAAVWMLAGLFVGWLVLTIYRTWKQVCAKAGGESHDEAAGARRVAVLLRNRADQVEWFVRRMAAILEQRPDLQIVLVDGGSTDGTRLMLERMARNFNLGFRRMAELNPDCRAAADADEPNTECKKICWSNCFNQNDRLNFVNYPVVCFDLRGVTANELLRYKLSLVGL